MGLPSKSGNSGNGGNERPDETQQRIAEELFSQTDPLRRGMIGRSTNFIRDPNDVFNLPGYAAVKDTTESQYGRARDSIIANTPEGGALTSALVDLERNRASDLVRGTAQLNDAELARAMTLATGTTGQSLAGLGSAGAIQAQREASDTAGKTGMASALATGAGAYFGSK